MRIALVHHHLDPGGVTSVLAAASQALTTAGIRHVILSGSLPIDSGLFPGEAGSLIRTVEGLGYLRTACGVTACHLLESMAQAAAAVLGGPPDVWHFHNPSLGKNCLFPEIIDLLATTGARLVLQIHDLAEHGRPANYPLIANRPHLYPFSPRIRYAFLNPRDLEIFTAAGLPADSATLLPNPVPPPLHFPRRTSPDSSPLFFAPIRGIRRKNLGELLLLAALAPAGTRIAVSRAPLDPAALVSHDSWQALARDLELPVEFAVVDRLAPAEDAGTGFDSWIGRASHFVTTSVSEGFGLPFLEAIAHGKPLIGRDLPHLTREHARHGIHTGNLYNRLLIPAEWMDPAALEAEILARRLADHQAYGRPLPLETLAGFPDCLTHGRHLDFGNLPESLQRQIITRVATSADRRVPQIDSAGHMQSAVDWLATAVAGRSPGTSPEQLAPYSPAAYQLAVTRIYADLMSQPPSPIRHLPPMDILTPHLAPAAFHFLLSTADPPAVKFRAAIFDLYGTLLIAPAGGVQPDPDADPVLREIITRFGFKPPSSPSTSLHAAVLRHHASAGGAWPEIDLRDLWREILDLPPETDTAALVAATESSWHPATLMPGADEMLQQLARWQIPLGVLSNAQCNALSALNGAGGRFAQDLTILSYQHGIAKPSPALFELLADRLAVRGIPPSETLYLGNDPLHDILPAAAAGFRTVLFTGHPDSFRAGASSPDFTCGNWRDLARLFRGFAVGDQVGRANR